MPEIDYAHLRRLCGWDMTTRRPGGSRRIVHAGLTWPGLVVALLDEVEAARADLAALTRDLADERAAVAIAHERIAEVTAERDARPEISREDAERIFADLPAFPIQFPIAHAEWKRIETALRAHAAGSGKGGS